jgi:hypothetical protein
MLTVLTLFSAFVLTLIILVPVRPSRENVISMPSVRCGSRSGLPGSTGRAGGGSRTDGAPRRAPAAVPGSAHRRLAWLASGPTCGPLQSPYTPAARSPRTRNAGDRRPRAWRRASPFFVAISLSIALSSIASARSFLSLAFSSSSAFSRLASDTSAVLALPLVEGRA